MDEFAQRSQETLFKAKVLRSIELARELYDLLMKLTGIGGSRILWSPCLEGGEWTAASLCLSSLAELGSVTWAKSTFIVSVGSRLLAFVEGLDCDCSMVKINFNVTDEALLKAYRIGSLAPTYAAV